jgi:hypothetical protein
LRFIGSHHGRVCRSHPLGAVVKLGEVLVPARVAHGREGVEHDGVIVQTRQHDE